MKHEKKDKIIVVGSELHYKLVHPYIEKWLKEWTSVPYEWEV